MGRSLAPGLNTLPLCVGRGGRRRLHTLYAQRALPTCSSFIDLAIGIAMSFINLISKYFRFESKRHSMPILRASQNFCAYCVR